jgi:tetratricopeptide (TPR) repeat protein
MGLVKRFFHGKHVKPTSSKNTIESDDSYLNYLPQHVVDDSLNREDDVSSIHYGESVGTPFTAKALGHANRNIKRSTEQSRAELNFLVSVNSSPMKILENTDGEVSTMGGDSILHESENESESKKEGASKVTHSLLGERKEEEEEDYELEIGDDGHVQSEGEQSTLDGVEVYNPREGPKTKSTDMSVFCLSLLTDENSRDAKSLPERIVRDTLKRHLDLYNNEMELAKNIGTDECESQVDNFKALRNDPKKMETLAQTLVSQGHADKAITLYKQLLVHQRKHPDADPSETLSKLAILHLYQGNLKSSHGYSKQALKLNREESRQAQIATSLMSMGLLYFGCDQSDKALRTWREALQMVCLVFGYDHTYVAIILNNIGCLHYHRGDFSASQKIFSESLDLQRKFLSSSVGCINNILLDIATTKGNIATTMAKVDDIDSAMALFEEVLSLQESVVVDREHFLVRLTSQNMDRISRERADTFSSQPAAPVRNIFGTSVMTCQTKGTSEAAFLQTCETFPIHRIEGVNPSVFGDMDGIPMRRIGAQSPLDAIDATDNLDVILLGSLSNEYSPSQRVRAAVLAWFGKTLEEEDAKTLPFVPFGGVTPRKRSCVPVDLDQDNVLDAELHLEGINQQAAEHLEVSFRLLGGT